MNRKPWTKCERKRPLEGCRPGLRELQEMGHDDVNSMYVCRDRILRMAPADTVMNIPQKRVI
jgi:hypothetical protein